MSISCSSLLAPLTPDTAPAGVTTAFVVSTRLANAGAALAGALSIRPNNACSALLVLSPGARKRPVPDRTQRRPLRSWVSDGAASSGRRVSSSSAGVRQPEGSLPSLSARLARLKSSLNSLPVGAAVPPPAVPKYRASARKFRSQSTATGSPTRLSGAPDAGPLPRS